MKVSVVRGGGVAGIATRTELSSDTLPEREDRTLEALVRAAKVGEKRASGGRRTLPDQLLYELVVDDGDSVVRARFSDDDLPDGVRRLVEWVDGRPERSRSRER